MTEDFIIGAFLGATGIVIALTVIVIIEWWCDHREHY